MTTLLLTYRADTNRYDYWNGPYEFVVPPRPRSLIAKWRAAWAEKRRQREIRARQEARWGQVDRWATREEAARLLKIERAPPIKARPRKRPKSMSVRAAKAYGYAA